MYFTTQRFRAFIGAVKVLGELLDIRISIARLIEGRLRHVTIKTTYCWKLEKKL